MRFALSFFILFLFAKPVFAEMDQCRDLFKSQQFEDLASRLKKHFQTDSLEAVPLSDAEAASYLLKKLGSYGSQSQMQLFDLILQIHESTLPDYEVRTPGFYIDLETATRFKSQFFQERHWDWNILDGYFFNGPLTPEFSRDQDGAYLKHILKTAQSFHHRVGLKQVLEMANESWAIQNLDRSPELLNEFKTYAEKHSYESLYSKTQEHFLTWVKSASTPDEKSKRLSQVRFTLRSFRNSHSKFDLMVVGKYFDLVTKFQVSANAHQKVPKWLQLTDSRVYEMTLPYGSLHYVTDFLFQNSHDISSKAYLLRILHRMGSLPVTSPGDVAFYFGFINAKNLVDEEYPPSLPTESFRTDLHIFSKRLQPGNTSDAFDQILLTWNGILGHPQINVTHSRPLDPRLSVSSDPQLRSYIQTYFDNFRKNQTYSQTETDHDEALELNASLFDSTYLVFTERGRDLMRTMIRIFDGTHSPTYIEREFKHIRLPERQTGENIYEIGRLFATAETNGKSLEMIMAPVAEYFKNTNATGSVYLDANRAAMIYYKRFGAKLVFEPKDLNLSPTATPIWIMRFSVEEIIQKFYKPVYQSVQLR